MHRLSCRIVLACLLTMLAAEVHAQAPLLNYSGDPGPFREWSDATKSFRVEAQLLRVVDNVVHLKRRDNSKEIAIPLDKLSEDDVAVVRGLAQPGETGQRSQLLTADKLEATAKRQRTAEKALGLYGLFMNDARTPAAEKEKAKAQYENWQLAADKSLVRLGSKWVTPEKADELELEETRLFEDATRLYETASFDRAEQRFREAMRVQPDSIRSNFRIGLFAAILERDAPKAEANFQACISRRISWRDDLTPSESANLSAALNNLAIAELRQRQYTSALGRWTQAMEIAPTTPEIMQNLGRLVYLSRPDVRAKLGAKATLSLTDSEQRRAESLYAQASRGVIGRAFDPTTGWLYIGDIREQVIAKPPEAKAKPPEAKAKPAISGQNDPFSNLRHASSGTGFVIAPGYVMTNAHVAENADGFYVVAADKLDSKLPATVHVVSQRVDLDLAVLHCPTLHAPPLDFSPRLPQLGADIRLIGFPLPGAIGLSLKVTGGLVSALPPHAGMEGKYKDYLLYDAVINPGNSGGPACDKYGHVVAVNTAILLKDAIGGGYAAGVGADRATLFLTEHLKGVRDKWHSTEAKELSWEEAVGRVGASTVYIMALQDPAKLDLAERFSDARRMKGSWTSFEDPWCMACHGSGECKCTNRECKNGKVDGYRNDSVPLLGGGQIVKKVRIDAACSKCSGKGRIRCTSCTGGIDAVFFIRK